MARNQPSLHKGLGIPKALPPPPEQSSHLADQQRQLGLDLEAALQGGFPAPHLSEVAAAQVATLAASVTVWLLQRAVRFRRAMLGRLRPARAADGALLVDHSCLRLSWRWDLYSFRSFVHSFARGRFNDSYVDVHISILSME